MFELTKIVDLIVLSVCARENAGGLFYRYTDQEPNNKTLLLSRYEIAEMYLKIYPPQQLNFIQRFAVKLFRIKLP